MNTAMIVVGMVVVFISVFFVLFTYDGLMKDYLECNTLERVDCADVSTLGFGVGLFIVFSFIIVDGGVIYILTTNIAQNYRKRL